MNPSNPREEFFARAALGYAVGLFVALAVAYCFYPINWQDPKVNALMAPFSQVEGKRRETIFYFYGTIFGFGFSLAWASLLKNCRYYFLPLMAVLLFAWLPLFGLLAQSAMRHDIWSGRYFAGALGVLIVAHFLQPWRRRG